MPEQAKSNAGERVLRLDETCQKVGLKRTSIYDLMSEGKFPRPVKLTTQRRGWLLSEVEAWLTARKSERDVTREIAP